MQLFSADATILEKLKRKLPLKTKTKTTSKVAHNWRKLLSVLPTGPKPAQISISVP